MPFTADSNGTSNGNKTSAQPLTAYSLASESSTSERLSEADLDVLLNLMTQMREKLPFLRDINAEERRTLFGMGNKNRIFAGKVLEVIQQDPSFLPRSFDAEKLQQDLITYDRLSKVLMALDQLRDLVDATTISIGSEAYENALTAYRHAKASDRGASLEGMMAEMSQRFARKSKKKASKDSQN